MLTGRARRFPLPDNPGQVKLPVGQVDLNRFFFLISYKQIEEFQNSWSQASDDFEKRRTLLTGLQLLCHKNDIMQYSNPTTALIHSCILMPVKN